MPDRPLWIPATWRLSLWQKVALGVAAALVAASLRLALTPILRDEAAFTPNFLALFAATFIGGWEAGLISMLLGGLITYFYFFDPPGTFARPSFDLLSLLLFWVVSGLSLLSVAGLRSALSHLAQREQALLLAQEQEQLLSREMGHRVKNLLAVVQGVVEQSLRGSSDLADARERIAVRLKSLATAQELALSPIEAVSVAAIVKAAMGAIGDGRVELEMWADGEIETERARGIILALHELATNALKYGALSRPEGRVLLRIELAPPEAIRIEWRESGGPPVRKPATRGFGTRLITHALTGRDEEVRLTYPSDGVQCDFRLRAADPHALGPDWIARDSPPEADPA
jgi:two-component sensor histidine kinase